MVVISLKEVAAVTIFVPAAASVPTNPSALVLENICIGRERERERERVLSQTEPEVSQELSVDLVSCGGEQSSDCLNRIIGPVVAWWSQQLNIDLKQFPSHLTHRRHSIGLNVGVSGTV